MGNGLINISPSYLLLTLLLPAKYHQMCEAAFGRCEHLWVYSFVSCCDDATAVGHPLTGRIPININQCKFAF